MRTALVCGGASGIGLATARRLAAAGTNIVLLGRSAERLVSAVSSIDAPAGVHVDHLVGDIAAAGSAEAAVTAVEERYGSLDVLVLNAGGPPPGRVLEVSDAEWIAATELLLVGPMRFARKVLPRMAKQGFGRVVVVTSTAVQVPQPDLALSVVLRAAMTNAVRLLCLEFAAEGVTVNCVAPGATATQRRSEILRKRASAQGLTLGAVERHDIEDIPAGRAGDPDEVAAAIAFLCSEIAGYINGAVLTVDGGKTQGIQ